MSYILYLYFTHLDNNNNKYKHKFFNDKNPKKNCVKLNMDILSFQFSFNKLILF